MNRVIPTLALPVTALALLLIGGPAGAQENPHARILERVSPAIVTVKAVLKTEMSMQGMPGQSEEQRVELQGVVVHASGLVMLSNADISAERMKQALGGGNPKMGDLDLNITPTEFKIVFENEEKEYPAFFVAKDTKLDLAFVQVQELEERQLTAVDFGDAGEIAIGGEIVSVNRLKKGFDYAPYFQTGLVSGAIKKPRRAWKLDGGLGGYGLPVFDRAGKVLGALVTLAPTTTTDSSAGQVSTLLRMLSGGGVDTGVGTFLLPANVVARVVQQSRERAQELIAKGETGDASREDDEAEKDESGEEEAGSDEEGAGEDGAGSSSGSAGG